MERRGSTAGFIFTLIGGLLNIFVSVNVLAPSLSRQLWSLYLAIIGAVMLAYSFRMQRSYSLKNASIWSICLGIFSINPLSIIGGIIGLVKRR